ncbi:MAG TPA: SPFH domain-containing protein [Alphaproteobacteria bacterium]|nr:SPFH domain-containing protein [Alphaproteobacteria bacterium]
MEFTVLALVVVAVAVLLVVLGVRTVPQGSAMVVERLGRFNRVLTPGLNFIVPVIDSVRARPSLMETVLDVPEQQVITRDNAIVRVDGVVFYQVLDAARATYEIANLQNALLNLTMTNIRTVMGSMDMDELLSQRERINADLLRAVDEATNPWGVKVARIEIRDIQPPADLVAAMARQLKAEREKRATILEAEGSRQSNILRAQGELEAARLQAEARERLAEAEAKATQMVSAAVAGGNVQALNYFVAQKYVEALHALASAPNQKVLMLPTDVSGPLAALAGVAELAQEAIAHRAAASAAPRPAPASPWTLPAGDTPRGEG